MTLQELHQANGAILAADGIPLHYGDLGQEYDAGLSRAILLDRSHEGRVRLTGQDRFELLNRMSTNKMVDMQPNEGRPTIFTNANARIIDRIIAYNRGEYLCMITEPGRGTWLRDFLHKHIFFNDDVQPSEITAQTVQFALHGPQADAIMQTLGTNTRDVKPLHGLEIAVADATIFAARRKAVSGSHWLIATQREKAASVYQNLMKAGQAFGLLPAGSLTYNTLRIRAGRPARPELNADFIPLEVGLWDEVHFAKGCYTGQEIIARMESRGKLAKTIVRLNLSEFVQAPVAIFDGGRQVGTLTSCVQAPTHEIFAMAVLKTSMVEPEKQLRIGEKSITATISHLLGQQPEYLR